ncbi:MAG: hemolysin family protein [Planctomycetaceae bacterium]
MSDSVILIAGCVCLLGSFFLSFSGYCLRNYSRSRLAHLCRVRQLESRFGSVLKLDEDAELATELAYPPLLVLGVGLLAVWRYALVETRPFSQTMVAVDVLAAVLGGIVVMAMLPWTLSLVCAERFLYRFWPVLWGILWLMQPFMGIAARTSSLFYRIAGRIDPESEKSDVFAEEIQSVVDEGEREGAVESRAGRMIQRVMELRDEDVEAVMTPRTDIVCLPAKATLEEARQLILESGHSRIPLIGDTPDDIQGILYARDLLEHWGNNNGDGVSLAGIAREPFYIPETTNIEKLLEMMQRERLHVAIVLDEYGGVTGLVTMEDLLEEIVGNIDDEFDEAQQEQIEVVDEATINVDARMHLDDLNELYGYDLPEDEDFDTIGGFVFSELGRIPQVGSNFTWRHLDIKVLEADKRKIVKLQIHQERPAVEVMEES